MFLCFPQFGGSYHSLNFDKFRDTASLLINNYSMSAHWIWDGWKPTRRVARSGIIVLLKTSTKYREFFPTIFVETTDFQLVFNFEQMCAVTTCGEHGIMAHIPWWLSQSAMMAKPIALSNDSVFNNEYYYMNSSLSWNDVVNPVFWLATRAKRMILPSRTCLVTMAIDTDMGYWPRHCFCFLFFFFFSRVK